MDAKAGEVAGLEYLGELFQSLGGSSLPLKKTKAILHRALKFTSMCAALNVLNC